LPRQHPEIAPAGGAEPSARPSSFDALYADHFPFVWRCLRGLGVPDAALDDATQDVFLAVHSQLPAFRGESAVRTWLFGIVRNVASNQRRSAKRKGGHGPLDDQLPSTGPGPADRVEELQAAGFVRGFLAKLDEGRRELFVMVLLEEISVPDAAAALGMPLNTAYTRVRRMRVAFQEALARREGKT
jgi:RNA polymerase sigma-70 factor (ECF subfamily)